MNTSSDQPEQPESLYSNHATQFRKAHSQDRSVTLEKALVSAFTKHIAYRQVGYILFSEVSSEMLAEAFFHYPVIVKSILAIVNVAGRAIRRDLGVDINTYAKKISMEKAAILSGYIKPLLPKEMAIPALVCLDDYVWTDKALRATKGSWEVSIREAINRHSTAEFRKKHFKNGKNDFELDAAHPKDGASVQIGIDIKRIESKRDIHKRSDEIVNKAMNLKAVYPRSKFFVIIYYPMPHEHINLKTRLEDENVDGIFFAGETQSSLDDTAKHVLARVHLLKTT